MCRHLQCYLAAQRLFLITILLLGASRAAYSREKDVLQYGAGLIVNIPLPEPEVAQVVEEVAQNTIIRGTKEYNKDEYVAAAVEMKSTPVFPAWTDPGKVFYKVRKQALDPRNFKDSGDVGTLAVRYVVVPQGEKNTVLRIDAIFVEDFRRTAHASNGSVESAEYKDIQDRLASVELMKKETADALEAKKEWAAKQSLRKNNTPASTDSTLKDADATPKGQDTVLLSTPPTTAQPADASGSTAPGGTRIPGSAAAPTYESYDEPVDKRIAELRQQVERLVRKPGAPLKSAPFHTASTLKSLDPGTEVLIVISTPYWYGVETHDGEHGWIRRDELEMVP